MPRARRTPTRRKPTYEAVPSCMAYGPDAARRAQQAFQRALTFDPKHAGAHAGLSRAYVVLGQFGMISEADARQSALAAARAAVDLNDDLAEAHRALADLNFFFDWDWARRRTGVSEDARAESQLLTSADDLRRTARDASSGSPRRSSRPRSLEVWIPSRAEVTTSSAVVLLYARKLDEARALIEQTLLEQPGSAGGSLCACRVADAQGSYREALRGRRSRR